MDRPIDIDYEASDLARAAEAMDGRDNLYVRDLLLWAADRIDGLEKQISHTDAWREKMNVSVDEIG